MQYNETVIKKIKSFLKDSGNTKVFDKDVANILEISNGNLSMMKKRDKLPLKEIINFCVKNKININWLIYSQIPESLEKSTENLIHKVYNKSNNIENTTNIEKKMIVDAKQAESILPTIDIDEVIRDLDETENNKKEFLNLETLEWMHLLLAVGNYEQLGKVFQGLVNKPEKKEDPNRVKFEQLYFDFS